MNREEKVKIIKEIRNGMPIKLALNKNKYKFLTRNQDEDFYQAEDGTIITEEERLKYYSDSIICVNVSKQFRVVNGKTVKK